MTTEIYSYTDSDLDTFSVEPSSGEGDLFVTINGEGAWIPAAPLVAALTAAGYGPKDEDVKAPAPAFTGPGKYRIAEGAQNYDGDLAAADIGKVVTVSSGYVDSDGDVTLDCDDECLSSCYVGVRWLVPADAVEAPAKKVEDIEVEDIADLKEIALLIAARTLLDPTGVDRVSASDIKAVANVIRK